MPFGQARSVASGLSRLGAALTGLSHASEPHKYGRIDSLLAICFGICPISKIFFRNETWNAGLYHGIKPASDWNSVDLVNRSFWISEIL